VLDRGKIDAHPVACEQVKGRQAASDEVKHDD
jgi:hypothetical protein